MRPTTLLMGLLAAVTRSGGRVRARGSAARVDARVRFDRPGIEMTPGASTLATNPFIR
ncbi:MAG TPA: hypothetical protein VGB42_11235 [Candidatus Thermoplasmatota archaeon]